MSPAAAGMSQELEEVQGGETQQGFGLPTSWLVLTCELDLRMGIWVVSAGRCTGFCMGRVWVLPAAAVLLRHTCRSCSVRQGTNPGSLSFRSIRWSETCLGVASGQGLLVTKLSSGAGLSWAGSSGQQSCNRAH